uniref:TSC22 domain family protein 3 n=1 Tax=Laticauda laticaudata TaxID=8630 RepID=A0A8C5S1Z5_LATLA
SLTSPSSPERAWPVTAGGGVSLRIGGRVGLLKPVGCVAFRHPREPECQKDRWASQGRPACFGGHPSALPSSQQRALLPEAWRAGRRGESHQGPVGRREARVGAGQQRFRSRPPAGAPESCPAGPAGACGARTSAPSPPAPAPRPSRWGGSDPGPALRRLNAPGGGDRAARPNPARCRRKGAEREAKTGCWPNSPERQAKPSAAGAARSRPIQQGETLPTPPGQEGGQRPRRSGPVSSCPSQLSAPPASPPGRTGMSSSPLKARRSPVGLDCCSCCLDLANGPLGYNSNLSALLQLREQRPCESLGAASELRRLMRQDSPEPVVRDPRYLLSRGICNRNIDQTLLSILLFFHSASGASVVAIDNKIEQAMDLVKNHLMYAVREEVEVLKEQIKELAEKNSRLERENSLLKNLASPEQLQKFRSHLPLEAPAGPEKKSPGGPAQHRAGSAV